MPPTTAQLKTELSQLSIQDRAELAYFLIHSLDETVDVAVETAWDEELSQRIQAIETGIATGQPAHQVCAELRAKYS